MKKIFMFKKRCETRIFARAIVNWTWGTFDPSKLELSTYNFIDSILEESDKYLSLRRLLKEGPKIKGVKER